MELTEMPEFLTSDETAGVVRKTPATLAQDRYLGRGLPYIKAGARILYARADVLAYLAANRNDPSEVSA